MSYLIHGMEIGNAFFKNTINYFNRKAKKGDIL
jgi:hypothetical protein